MTYKCTNEKCGAYNQEVSTNIHFTFGTNGTVDHNLICPICGKEREVVQEDKGLCITTMGRPNVPN